MRKELLLFGLVLGLGCGGGSGSDDSGDATPPPDTAGTDVLDALAPDTAEVTPLPDAAGQEVAEARSRLERQAPPAVPGDDQQALAQGNADFAMSLYRYLAAKDGDVFVAPISISIALAQVWAGAKGQTADEIAQSLHFTLPAERLHGAFNALDQTLEGRGNETVPEGEPFRLSIVNALWGQAGYPFVQDYLDLLALNYGAGLNLVDFLTNAEAARLAINAWVAAQTNDRIRDLLAPGAVDSMTRLVLTNAIYFHAGWFARFGRDLTVLMDFHRLDGSTVPVQMMRMEEPSYVPHAVAEQYEAVALPYVGEKVAMLVILPKEGHFQDIEASLDGARFLAILDSLASEEGTVQLPRFGMEYKTSLTDALRALGMQAAFSESADFTGISPTGELLISDVIHQTFLQVDEDGTEAAGATAVVFGGTSVPPPEPFRMVVDRPFVFAIVDLPTRSILFLGRITDPT